MRTIFFTIAVIALCSIAQKLNAQLPQSPDTVLITHKELRALFYSNAEDTLGLRRLTSKTSLNEYKGKENKHIMRAMRSIKSSMDGNTIYNKIAGVDIKKTLNASYDPRETHFLHKVWYRITHKGVLVVGERGYAAPWHDIISPWKVVNCYLVGLIKKLLL